jgi:hypothetical protein
MPIDLKPCAKPHYGGHSRNGGWLSGDEHWNCTFATELISFWILKGQIERFLQNNLQNEEEIAE